MIYLIGGSGGPNFGDDLILALWIQYYREGGYEGPIIVDCRDRKPSEKLHARFENVHFTSYIKNLATGRGGTFASHIARGRDFIDGLTDEVTRSLPETGVVNIGWEWRQIRHVHLYGGGYINGRWPNSASLLGAAAQLREKHGIPCFATGLGLSPLSGLSEEDTREMAKTLRSFSLFEVRDHKSYNELTGITGFLPSLICGLDDSFLYPISRLVRRRDRPGKALHLSGFDKSFDNISDKDLSSFLDTYRAHYDKVYFWVCNRSDIEVGDRLLRVCPDLVKLTTNGLINNGAPVHPDDFMITSRFHPHLVAARAGATGNYLAHSEYYSIKHSSVVDLGSPYEVMSNLGTASPPCIRNVLMTRDGDLATRKQALAQVLVASAVGSSRP